MTSSIHLRICMSGCIGKDTAMRKRSSACQIVSQTLEVLLWVSSTVQGGHTAPSLAFFLISFLIRASGQRCVSHSLFPYGGGSMQPHNSPPLSSSQVLLGQSAPTQGSSTTPAKKENTETHNLIFTPTRSSIGLHSRFDTQFSRDRSGRKAEKQGDLQEVKASTHDCMFTVSLHCALA